MAKTIVGVVVATAALMGCTPAMTQLTDSQQQFFMCQVDEIVLALGGCYPLDDSEWVEGLGWVPQACLHPQVRYFQHAGRLVPCDGE